MSWHTLAAVTLGSSLLAWAVIALTTSQPWPWSLMQGLLGGVLCGFMTWFIDRRLSPPGPPPSAR